MTLVNQDKCTLKLIDVKESDMISLHKQTTERQNKISFLRLFVLSRCTSRQNEEMEFHFFVSSFCRVVQVDKTKKRQNKEMEFHFFVCSFCRVVQVAKTKKWISFLRFFVLSRCTSRQNEETTKRRNGISFLRFFVLSRCTSRQNKEMDFISSFLRFVVLVKARQNDKVTAKYQSLIFRGYLFVLSFVRFVDFHKAPKRQNDNATK